MDRNFVLAMALSFLVLSLWMFWQGEQRRSTLAESAPAGTTSPAGRPESPSQPASPFAAAEPAPTPAPAGQLGAPAAPPVTTPAEEEERVKISLPLYSAEFTTRGGALLHWELKHYLDRQGVPVTLTTLRSERELALATPFIDLGEGDLSQAPYTLERPSEHTLRFVRSQRDVTIRKTYRMDPATYELRLGLEVANDGRDPVSPSFALLWPARTREGADYSEQALVALHEGSIQKTPLTSLGSPGFMGGLFGGGAVDIQTFAGDVDWAGASTRYFLAAMLPDVPRETRVRFVPQERGTAGLTVLEFPEEPIPSGHRVAHELIIYLGPKGADELAAVGAHLDRAIDYGYSWVAPLTRFFTWLMRALHGPIPNYGIVIILITIAVRLVTAPLTARQMRSMKRLSKLQPKMKELQEKHGDDRAKLQQEMMALYKREGMNPLTAMGGGCMPLLLQFPVFIGLFYALQNAIELRQASFMLWIDDLSAPETLFMIPGMDLPVRLLPLLMGGSMVLQQKLSPQTMDAAQARMMATVMPVVFTALFYQFPSGLVLYWLVSNLLAIAHQAWMNRGTPGTA